MLLNITAVTHPGTHRDAHQDCILVQNQVLLDGVHSWLIEITCTCFVADGIGGNPDGEVATQFVLEQIQLEMELDQ